MNHPRLAAMCEDAEGRKTHSYLCPAGIWTIGVGATGRDIGPGLVWTNDQIDRRLDIDCDVAVAAALKLCPRLWLEPEERLVAIADFVFNLGSGRLAASTLRTRVNQGDWNAAVSEILKWVWGGGRKLPGLIKRRKADASLLLLEN